MNWIVSSLLALVLTLANTANALTDSTKSLGPTPLNYFGLVMHRLDSGTPWPPFKFGAWRLWDAYVGWPDVEPSPGDWRFKRLDLYVAAANAKGVEIVYPLGLSAPWASARPAEKSGYKPGYAAEPSDLEHWRRYVRTVAERYKGRIKYYEVWNEPSDKTYFSGEPETLVRMLKIAYETVKQVDPEAKVIAPGVTGVGRHLAYLDDLLGRGAKDYIDVLGHHFYVPNGEPEEMVPLIREVRKIMLKHGIENKPLWNTETGWWIGNSDGTPDHPMVAKGGWKKFDSADEGGGLLVRAFVLARAEGVERFFWYSWDNLYGLGMREPTAGIPKPMAKYFSYVVTLLQGWSVAPCESTLTIWTCKLERAGESPRWLVWSTKDSVSWTIPAGLKVVRVSSLDGASDQSLRGRVVDLGRMPILLY